MNTLKMSVVKTWICATGVAVVSAYCICTNRPDTPTARKHVEKEAACMSKRGTVKEYKPEEKTRHSSAVSKTTTAKVVSTVKEPTYIPNPLYPPFTNALNRLTAEIAAMAGNGKVELTDGFVLSLKKGMPHLQYPDAYTNVVIGRVAMGDVLKDGSFGVSRKKIKGSDRQMMDGIGLSRFRRLDEPEFYCTDVTYSMLPATRQVDAIHMHGNLTVDTPAKAQAMVEEITGWMKEDFGAVDQKVDTPDRTLALKKFKIGSSMNVEVKVTWKNERSAEGCDSDINIIFTTGELVEEDRSQRQELGKAMDEVRARTLRKTGVNYFSVRPTVNADAVAKKVVY